MGFILRSVFWLTLASIVIPVEARFGYDGNDTGRDVPLSEQMHDAAYAAWGFAVQLGNACETNPSLCTAGQNLIDTVSETSSSLLQEAEARFMPPKKAHLADASTHAQQHKKFQDRIE